MGRPTKLDSAAKKRILELAPNHSLSEIAEALAAEGIEVGRSTVSRFLKAEWKGRAEETRGIVQDKLRAGVTTDLDVLERMRNTLDNWWQGLNTDGTEMRPPPRVSERLMVIDRLTTILDKRLKYSGADPGDGDKTLRIEFVDPDDEPETE